MRETRIAIIGCGKQAEKHISGLSTIPGVEIVLSDSDESRAKALAEKHDLPWESDVNNIFSNDDIAAVDICTPTPSHFGLITAALDSDKDFLCEKPLTATLGEARELAERIENSDRVGMVGYIYRFAPVFELGYSLFKDIPKSGASMVLGSISSAFFRLSGRGSHQPWKHTTDEGGGAINEMLVHMVDLAIWYFGPVKNTQVLACDLIRPQRMIANEMHDVDAEDYVLVKLEMENGINVTCQADLVTPAFIQLADIQGEYGTFAGSIQSHYPYYLHLEREVAGYQSGRNDFQFGQRNLFKAQMAEFINSVRNGEQPSRSTVKDSVLLMEAMNKIKEEIK